MSCPSPAKKRQRVEWEPTPAPAVYSEKLAKLVLEHIEEPEKYELQRCRHCSLFVLLLTDAAISDEELHVLRPALHLSCLKNKDEKDCGPVKLTAILGSSMACPSCEELVRVCSAGEITSPAHEWKEINSLLCRGTSTASTIAAINKSSLRSLFLVVEEPGKSTCAVCSLEFLTDEDETATSLTCPGCLSQTATSGLKSVV